MPEKQTYNGSCHCGRVRYEVTTDLAKVMACNCSICSRAGYLLTFVQPEQFKLHSGEDALSDYQFAKKHIHHQFCSTCGVRSFATGTAPGGAGKMFAINVRCLEGVDVGTLKPTAFDGKSL
jgi:hypothetical protein